MRPQLFFFVALIALTSCASNEPLEEPHDDTGVRESFEPDGIGDDFDVRADAVSGPSFTRGASTEVWALRNAWADTDTPEARAAGIAWAANSGLSWEQKYQRWIESLPKHRDGRGAQWRDWSADEACPQRDEGLVTDELSWSAERMHDDFCASQ